MMRRGRGHDTGRSGLVAERGRRPGNPFECPPDVRETPVMSAELLHAVLAAPDLQRFREVTGVGDAHLDVTFEGWSKLAVLSHDRVFLFPRRGRDARMLHGARVCEVLSSMGVSSVPRVVGRWPEGELSAGPFVAFERRSGTGWEVLEDGADFERVERMLRSLGDVIATWHRIDVSGLPSDLQQARFATPDQPWLRDFLDPHRVENAVDEAVRLLQAKPAWSSVWRTTLRALSAMTPVLLHGDVCENQLLINAHGQVATVLDWDTAGIGHPLYDFDFGQWGFGIFTWGARFSELRTAMWQNYRAGRPNADLPSAGEVHLLFTLSELAYLEQRSRQGSIDDWGAARLAICREAIGPATDAVVGKPPTGGRRHPVS